MDPFYGQDGQGRIKVARALGVIRDLLADRRAPPKFAIGDVALPSEGSSPSTETVTQPSRTLPSRGTPKRKHQASLNLQNWGGRTRTSNFPVNSRAVCQLTYTPKF